jgi:predicted dehydrogenase
MRILLIGSGAWGQKYISTLNDFPNVSLTVATRHNWKELIDSHPDGVIVCTPPSSHIEIASYALALNLPTMIEKPVSLSLREAQTLQQYSVPILVNHSHLFSHRYQKIKQNISSNSIDHIMTFGLGTVSHPDYSGLWDYGPHDLAMILDLTQQFPQAIQCLEVSPDCFSIVLIFDKFQTTSLVGHYECRQKYLCIRNDTQDIFDYQDTYCPNDRSLTNALQVFIDAIRGKPDYRLGLDLSLKVMQILEECQVQIIK